MQINIPVEMPKPADGTPAKTEETTRKGSGAIFAVEMNQILKLAGMNEGSGMQKCARNISESDPENFAGLFAGFGLPLTQPMNAEIVSGENADVRYQLPFLTVPSRTVNGDEILNQDAKEHQSADGRFRNVAKPRQDIRMGHAMAGKYEAMAASFSDERAMQQAIFDPLQMKTGTDSTVGNASRSATNIEVQIQSAVTPQAGNADRTNDLAAAQNSGESMAGSSVQPLLSSLNISETPGGPETGREISTGASVARDPAGGKEPIKLQNMEDVEVPVERRILPSLRHGNSMHLPVDPDGPLNMDAESLALPGRAKNQEVVLPSDDSGQTDQRSQIPFQEKAKIPVRTFLKQSELWPSEIVIQNSYAGRQAKSESSATAKEFAGDGNAQKQRIQTAVSDQSENMLQINHRNRRTDGFLTDRLAALKLSSMPKDFMPRPNLSTFQTADPQSGHAQVAVSTKSGNAQQVIQESGIAVGTQTGLDPRFDLTPTNRDFVFRSNPTTTDGNSQQSERFQVTSSIRSEQPEHAMQDNQGAGSRAESNSRRFEFALFGQSAGSFDGKQPESGRLQARSAENHSSAPLQTTANALRIVSSGSTVSSDPEQALSLLSKDPVYQIAERIQFQLREGKGEIRVQLRPDGLGRLEIRAETTANGVVARIVTEANSVKSYLENNLQHLQQNLQDQGLKVERIHITVQSGSDNQSGSGHAAQFGHSGSGHSPKESNQPFAPSSAAGMELSEDIAADPSALTNLDPDIRFHTIA